VITENKTGFSGKTTETGRIKVLVLVSRNGQDKKSRPQFCEYMSKDFDIDTACVDLPLFCTDWAMLWPAFKVLLKVLPSINNYDVVVTCSLINGLCLAVLQSVLGTSVIKPRHIIIDAGGTRYLSDAGRFLLLLLRWATSSLSMILCYAGSSRDFWKERVKFKGICNCEYLFIDAAYFDLGRQSGGNYILSAGRVERDYDTLIEAFSGIDAKLVVVGDRAGYESLKGKIGNNAQIDYHCEKYGKFYDEMLKKAQFVVIPLKDSAYHAGQTVLVQAMAAGKAVIATRSLGTIEYVTDGVDGLLVECGDADALRAAIVHLLQDDETRKRLAASAAEKAQRCFSEKRFAERLSTHVVELCSGGMK
jgi:glycosyltransferase involved in cell wall biosynthesis